MKPIVKDLESWTLSRSTPRSLHHRCYRLESQGSHPMDHVQEQIQERPDHWEDEWFVRFEG